MRISDWSSDVCSSDLVGLAGCDKSLPGMMMVMVRINVPSIFMYGGSILPGRFHGKDVTVHNVYEAVGTHSAGNLYDDEFTLLDCVASPSAVSLLRQFTPTPLPERQSLVSRSC